MRKLIISIVLFLQAVPLLADTITIRYRISQVDRVTLVWGVNDWQRPAILPEGAIEKGKSLRTPMRLQPDGYYEATLVLPAGDIVDYAFSSGRKAGPFGVYAGIWDNNKTGNPVFYHSKVGSNRVVNMEARPESLEMVGSVGMVRYGVLVLSLALLAATAMWAWRRYYLKTPPGLFNRTAYFFAVGFGLIAGLFYYRLLVANLLFPWLVDPLKETPRFFSVSWQDTLFAISMMLVFGLLMLVIPRIRRGLLIVYTVLAVLALLAAFANIKVTEMLGRPFNYQWFYYSDFLKSSDAILAVGANITREYILAGIFLLLAGVATGWLVYQLHRQRTWSTLVVLLLWLITSGITSGRYQHTPAEAANPVFYFIRSVMADEDSRLIDKKYAGVSEFYRPEKNRVPDSLANKIQAAGIRNLVFFVLESTPAEYVTPYNPAIRATPFLDAAVRTQGALFENIYAHIPATNKSMFSFLCSMYPDLSFRSVTRETPDIQLPSITSELAAKGYRTSFFNSGDNRFQNAEGFLKSRGFEVLKDFRDNECGSGVLSDKRYSESGLDGIDDSCLSVRFFNWLGRDSSRPFFSMMWSFQTHYPYFKTGQERDFGTGDAKLEKYLNGLHRADEALQALVAGLEARGILNQTLIIVTGDHGEAFGRHNQTTHASHIYEENLHVPLILLNPVLFSGERYATVGGITDLAPTAFSILQQPAPPQWQGQNLFSTQRRSRVYFFSPYGDFQFGFREGNQKFIFNATANAYELYDLQKDPQESNNLAPAQPAVIQTGAHHLKAWMYYQSAFMDSVLKQYTSTHSQP